MAGIARNVPRVITQGRIGVPVIDAGAIPRIQFSSGSAKALEAFSRDMFSLSNGFQDQLDAQAEAEATTQGAVAGATGEVELQTYGTIRGRAYNKAAIETYVTTMETNSIFKMAELQEKFGSDPKQLQAEIEAWGSGVASEVEKVYAPAGAAFRQRLAVRAMPAVEAAKDSRYKMTRDTADAALIENEIALKAEITSLAGDLFSENPARSEAAAAAVGALQGEYLAIFEASDPTTGRPLYSAEERAKAKVGFYEDVMENAALSWFDQQPDKAGAYSKFTEGEFTIDLKTPGADLSRVIEQQDDRAGVRKGSVQMGVKQKIAAAAGATDPRLSFVVTSGGQPGRGEGGPRTGSIRHDHGGSADGVLMLDGQELKPGDNPALYAKFLENAAAAGLTGIGHYSWGVHLGMGSTAAWGPNTRGNTLDPVFGAAIARGRAGPKINPTATKQSLDIRKALPDAVMGRIESEMRARISFNNTLRDREIAAEEKETKARQDINEFDLTNRLWGGKGEGGEALPELTREEITKAVSRGSISPEKGAAIVKAMATEKPATSDEATKRDALKRVYAGEDIYNFILDNQEKLSVADSAELLAKNQSLNVAGEGGMSKEATFHFNQLKDLLTPDSIMAKIDDGAEDRKYLALDEYRRRTEEGEAPRDVAGDLRLRAKLTFESMTNSKLDTMPRPRFFVPGAQAGRIDLRETGKALIQAQKDKRISPAEFERQKAALKEWADLQNALDRAPAVK